MAPDVGGHKYIGSAGPQVLKGFASGPLSSREFSGPPRGPQAQNQFWFCVWLGQTQLRRRQTRSADLFIIFPFCILCPQLCWRTWVLRQRVPPQAQKFPSAPNFLFVNELDWAFFRNKMINWAQNGILMLLLRHKIFGQMLPKSTIFAQNLATWGNWKQVIAK